VKASLRLISDKCKEERIEPPAIIIIGRAADSDARLSWFMKKPLFGKNIVVTRDARGNADFAAKIIRQGGNPIEFPTIKIKPLTQTNQFLQTLAKLKQYDWIVFTSANGVTLFFDCLENLGKDARVFGFAKVASIGRETAAKLGEFGIKADFVPNVFTSAELGKQLISFTNLQGKKLLLLRSQLASNELVKLLEQAGCRVDNVSLYSIATQTSECNWLIEKINASAIDWLTFASPSSVSGFFEQIPADTVNSSSIKVASIGPVTSEQLRSLGIKIDVESAEHTIDGLLTSIENTYK